MLVRDDQFYRVEEASISRLLVRAHTVHIRGPITCWCQNGYDTTTEIG